MSQFKRLKNFGFFDQDFRLTKLTNLNELISTYDTQFKDVYEAIKFLLNKDKQETAQIDRKRVGF